MRDRIQNALLAAGLPELPLSPSAKLADCGMDSLIMVMAMIEFEKSFQIKIPAKEFGPEWFESVERLEDFLKKQGAQ